MSQAANRARIINRYFTRDMEAAARIQLGNAFAQGKEAEDGIRFATASLGKEHEALVRRVWAGMSKVMWGAG